MTLPFRVLPGTPVARLTTCLLGLVVAGLVLTPLACSPSTPPDPTGPRLVILYATCSVNKQYLAPYDPSVRTTPNLSRFAQEGLVFERHQTESGQSGIAFASILSGAQADVHGVFSHPHRLSDDVELITESFARSGWEVHGWLHHEMASAALNYGQGIPPEASHSGLLAAGHPAFQTILTRLGREPRLRVLLVTTFTTSHSPYGRYGTLERFCQDWPDQCAARDLSDFQRLRSLYILDHYRWAFDYERQAANLSSEELSRLHQVIELLYRADIYHLDLLFGQLLGALQRAALLDESLIAFCSDHGEVRFRKNSHFQWTHGFQLAPEVLEVPWILRGPSAGIVPGRYPGVTRSIDVFPTLAGLSGLASPSGPQGIDLAEAIRRREPAPDLTAFSHTALFAEPLWRHFGTYPALRRLFPDNRPEQIWVGVRRKDRFVSRTRDPEGNWNTSAHDLSADPSRSADTFDPLDPGDRHLAQALHDYKEQLVEAALASGAEGAVDPARQEELLRSLGYIE